MEELKFDWKIVIGTVIRFIGDAFGIVGGVGEGGIFVPMLTLIIGFDEKSSTAISKCKSFHSSLPISMTALEPLILADLYFDYAPLRLSQ